MHEHTKLERAAEGIPVPFPDASETAYGTQRLTLLVVISPIEPLQAGLW